jgi:UDP:flavonoid glycosyltransferase YjiC (YdhE family)
VSRPSTDPAEAEAKPSISRVLFMTSNGTGLGHLTRSMAIARRLETGIEPAFFTLSAAAPVVRGQGFRVEYMGSYDTPGAGSHLQWSRRLRSRLEQLLADLAPSVLVFDGAHPYPAAVRAMRGAPELTTVWSRRPLWRPGRGRLILALATAFDLVLEPGELAAGEDAGLTAARRDEAVDLDPVVFCDPSELLPRAEAERQLDLEPGKVNVLVALGQGREVDAAVRRCLARLAPEPGVQVAALESSISSRLEVPEGVVLLRDTYPVSRYFRAFDFAVSAAGYNAYHELIAFAVPSVFVPMPRELDDQEARARYAETAGVALACESPGSERLEAVIGQMLDPDRRARMSARAAAIGLGNGAEEAARLLSRLAVAGRSELEGLPRPSGGRIAMWSTMAQARLSALLRHPFERGRDGIRSR